MQNSSLVRNVGRLITTPGMAGAYSKWLLSALVDNEGPAVPCSTTKIRGWASFSDYWSFRRGIAASTTRLIDHCLRTTKSLRPVAMDVGGHLGLFSAELAERGFAEVHTFEPSPRTFEKLSFNVAASPCARNVVKVNCMAVGPRSGWVEFESDPGAPGSDHMSLESLQAEGRVGLKRVPMISVDQYCEENEIYQLDFIKIDVEGFEPFVLDGARQTLSNGKVPYILLEMCPDLLLRAGTNPRELCDLLASYGYRPRHVTPNGTPGGVISVEELEKIAWADIVAMPV